MSRLAGRLEGPDDKISTAAEVVSGAVTAFDEGVATKA